ncbi:MAG: ATP-binding protein, partial [Cyclobacteriaceae bacterium]
AAGVEDSIYVFKKKGALAVELGNPDDAMGNFLKALDLVGDDYLLLKADIYNEIGLLYRSIREFDKSLSYFKEKIKIEEEIGYENLYRSYMNIGIIHLDFNQYDSAIKYFNLSYDGMDQDNDIFGLSLYYNNMGSAYSDMEQFQKARPYAEKAIFYKEKLGNKKRLANSYNLLSLILIGLGNYDQAEEKALLSLELLDSTDITTVRYNALRYLIQSRLKQQDTTDVEKLIYSMIELKNTTYDQQKTLAFSEMATKYDLERKEQELVSQRQDLQIAEGKIERQKLLRNSLIAGLFFLFLTVILIYRNQRLKSKANAELAAKNSEIQSLHEAKSKWFINVSHELRTPLTLVKGPLQRVVESDKLNPKNREILSLAHRNLNNLENLVNEILDLSKMENGKMRLNTTALNLTKLVREAASAFTSLATENKTTFTTQLDEVILVMGDYGKLHKAVTNLIANAMKFTHEGGEVSVKLSVRDGNIELLVTDTGEGISESDLPHIFNRFYQSAEKQQSRQGGTGIGLSLSLEIVRMHGGDILVESEPGKGSAFTLSLPAELLIESSANVMKTQIDVPSEVEELIAFSGFNNGKPSLLLVDDNADMRTFIRTLMEDDYHIIEARDGKDALEKMSEVKPDLILSDIMMPRMDGIDLIKRIKENEVWRKIPLIALTALAKESDKLYTLQIGIDDYLVKPFNPNELKVRAFNLINNSIVRKGATEGAETPRSHEEELIMKLQIEVERNLAESSFNVSRLADVAAMSERQLYRTVKQISGLTPSQFVREIRLRKAMIYLEQDRFATIAELSHAVGFEYPGYFSTVFEKRFGSKPAEYMTG